MRLILSKKPLVEAESVGCTREAGQADDPPKGYENYRKIDGFAADWRFFGSNYPFSCFDSRRQVQKHFFRLVCRVLM
jgi:hypothetical protein